MVCKFSSCVSEYAISQCIKGDTVLIFWILKKIASMKMYSIPLNETLKILGWESIIFLKTVLCANNEKLDVKGAGSRKVNKLLSKWLFYSLFDRPYHIDFPPFFSTWKHYFEDRLLNFVEKQTKYSLRFKITEISMDFKEYLYCGFTPSTKICAEHNGHVWETI